jgi:hypothetical protein
MLARDRLDRVPPATTLRPRALRAFGLVVLAGSFALLARVAWRDAPALAPMLRALRTPPALGALAATLVASLFVVGLWRLVLARLGLGLAPAEALAILSLTYLSRYVPGGIWSFAAVGYLGRRRGIPYRAGAFSLLLTLGIQGLTAIIWAAPIVVSGLRPGLAMLWPPLVLLAGLTLALAAPPTLRRLAGPLGFPAPVDIVPFRCGGPLLAVGGLAYWGLSGLATALLLRALGATVPPLPTLIGIVALAWLGGLLGSVAPAGLGVQDAAFILLLGTVVSPGAALGVALGTRALKTLNDAAYGVVGLVLYRHLGLGEMADANEPDGAGATAGGAGRGGAEGYGG